MIKRRVGGWHLWWRGVAGLVGAGGCCRVQRRQAAVGIIAHHIGSAGHELVVHGWTAVAGGE